MNGKLFYKLFTYFFFIRVLYTRSIKLERKWNSIKVAFANPILRMLLISRGSCATFKSNVRKIIPSGFFPPASNVLSPVNDNLPLDSSPFGHVSYDCTDRDFNAEKITIFSLDRLCMVCHLDQEEWSIEREQRRLESRKLGHRFARFPFTIPFVRVLPHCQQTGTSMLD